MTNKEYKPLTTGGYANSKMLSQYRDRLCYLEDCIENGKLVFRHAISATSFGGYTLPQLARKRYSKKRFIQLA